MQLRDFVTVVPRFTRAINLERDAAGSGGVDGYLVTTTAEGVLARFAETLKGSAGHRAWTLTGPYGSGKSAFALFLLKLLGPHSDDRDTARAILKDQAPELYRAGSPISHISKKTPPILILHGTADKTVALEDSKAFDEALEKAGVEHQLVIVEGAPHSFDLEPKQKDLRPLVFEFLDKNLKPK